LRRVSDRVAFYVGVAIVAALFLDLVFTGGDWIYFLSRKFMDLIEWIAFWR